MPVTEFFDQLKAHAKSNPQQLALSDEQTVITYDALLTTHYLVGWPPDATITCNSQTLLFLSTNPTQLTG